MECKVKIRYSQNLILSMLSSCMCCLLLSPLLIADRTSLIYVGRWGGIEYGVGPGWSCGIPLPPPPALISFKSGVTCDRWYGVATALFGKRRDRATDAWLFVVRGVGKAATLLLLAGVGRGALVVMLLLLLLAAAASSPRCHVVAPPPLLLGDLLTCLFSHVMT